MTTSISVSPTTGLNIGEKITVTIVNDSPQAGDWVGIWKDSDPVTMPLTYNPIYLDGTGSVPEAGIASATFEYPNPLFPPLDTYSARLCRGAVFSHTEIARSAAFVVGGAEGEHSVTVLSTLTPAPNSTISVHFVDTNPSFWNEYALCYRFADDETFYDAWFINGSGSPPGVADATLNLTAPNSSHLGEQIEVRLYFRPTYNNGPLFLLARSATMTVTNPVRTVTPESSVGAAGATMDVDIHIADAGVNDYIRLFSPALSETSEQQYLNGANTDFGSPPEDPVTAPTTLTFTLPEIPGGWGEDPYEVVFQLMRYVSGMDEVLTESFAVSIVAGDYLLTLSESSVAAGATLTVTVEDADAEILDQVQLYSAVSEEVLQFQYLNGTTSPPSTPSTTAELAFVMPAPLELAVSETFTVRLMRGSTSLVEIGVEVFLPGVTRTLVTIGTSFTRGDSISVVVEDTDAEVGDRVEMFSVYYNAPMASQYLNGSATTPPGSPVTDATLTFIAPDPGESSSMKFRLYRGSTLLVESSIITVSLVDLMNGMDVLLRLSGGLGNTSPALSLGGPMASAMVQSQSFTAATIPGLTLRYAGGNEEGDRTLGFYTYLGAPYVFWQGHEGTSPDEFHPNSDGRYVFDGGVIVDIDTSLLVGDPVNETITVANQNNTLFDPVFSGAVPADRVDYRCLYIFNEELGNENINSISVYIQSQPGAGSVAVGMDPAGIGDGITTGVAASIPDEETAPAGVTFSQPTGGAPLSVGYVWQGHARALWIRRTIPAGAEFVGHDFCELAFLMSTT